MDYVCINFISTAMTNWLAGQQPQAMVNTSIVNTPVPANSSGPGANINQVQAMLNSPLLANAMSILEKQVSL